MARFSTQLVLSCMRLRLPIALLILVATSCAQRSAVEKPQVVSEANLNTQQNELLRQVSQEVTLHGTFSLRGKFGPFIQTDTGPIYLVASDSFSWNDDHGRLEGKSVRVTGVLRFAHYADAISGTSSEGHPQDHFYFEAEKAKIVINNSQ